MRSKPICFRRRENGFSLMEILMVIVISGLVLAGAVPMISAWVENNRLTGAARKIVNDLHFCRQKAISKNLYYMLDFNTNIPITYDVKYGSVLGTYTTDQTVSLPESSSFASISATGDPVFNYRGMAVAAVTITLTNANNRVKTITVSPGGKISLN
ncbi:MAG: prepilin-type N-terminal cleavage/methylation domain-containing protein [Nitrospinales bacterium]